ncbi:hypothetical protein [Nocardioides zeicaulis]|uniref:Fibronectin type III domain-containing protein n=1 Tax=Nocardioides zeicaulis TaxID=1776857 RepID=A0ABV6E4X4_9ACTN
MPRELLEPRNLSVRKQWYGFFGFDTFPARNAHLVRARNEHGVERATPPRELLADITEPAPMPPPPAIAYDESPDEPVGAKYGRRGDTLAHWSFVSKRKSVHQQLNRIACAAALVGALVVAAPPAHAAGTAISHTALSVTTSPGATCVTIPVTWYVTVPASTDYWVIEADVLNSAGISVDDVFELEEPPITQTSSTLSFCGLAGPGSYTFRLYGQLRAEFDAGSTLLDETFTVTVPTTPPPPPPPPPATYATTVKLEKNVWFKRSEYARFGGTVEIEYLCSTTYCSGPERKVLVQGLSKGRWRTFYTRGGISSLVYVKVRVPYKYSKIRAAVEAVTAGDNYSADVSRTLAVPRR